MVPNVEVQCFFYFMHFKVIPTEQSKYRLCCVCVHYTLIE